MRTKSELAPVFIFLYFTGVVLLLTCFFLLVPHEWRTDAAWLDLAVAFVIYSIAFRLVAIWWARPAAFNTRIPALGLLWLSGWLYCILAIGLGWYGTIYLFSFRVQLAGQLCLLFLAAVAAAVAWLSSAHAAEVDEEEQEIRQGLERLKASIAQCESEILTASPIREQLRQRIQKLKEDARYLSPSSDASALLYEEQITKLMETARFKSVSGSTPSAALDLDGQLEQCAALMALRKQIR